MPDEQKQCTKCGEWKSLFWFYRENTQCRECVKAQRREHGQRNRERLNEYNHKYHQKNKVSVAARKRKHRQENKASIVKYRQNNKEAIAEYQRSQRSLPENRERKRIQSINRRARKRELPNTLTVAQWHNALNHFNGCCAICGRQMNDIFGEFHASADHWIPLNYKSDDNPGTVATNIIPLCHGVGGCNNKKKNAMPDVWLRREFNKRKAKKIMERIQKYFDSID